MVEISVLMPVYNSAPYLEDAINSVLSQEGPEFELLVGDDGSTDGSWEILENFASHPRLRISRNPANVGQGITRNQLAREAAGRFLVPCDSDDLLLPGNLREHYQQLQSHPECAAVYSGILVLRFDERGCLSEPPSVLSEDYREHWDLQENLISHGGCMLRRDRFLEAGGYEEDMRVSEDWGLWLRLVDIAPLWYHRGFVGYLWRRHPHQSTQNQAAVLDHERRKLVSRTLLRRWGKQIRWEEPP